jgi:acetylornithine deacetylase/succinyl-diaminopimelate desuccinylase-like protein
MIDLIQGAIQRERLLDTAIRLVNIPSPTRSAAEVADCLAQILRDDGFGVERPDAGWPDAPAVVARFESDRPGRTLQFNGHLDTVHLPYVPARVEQGKLYGSGASDMKGGVAVAVEAMRVLRETGLLTAGAVMLTAHDLHEAPWGDGSQLRGLIDAGYVGDGVLLPEYLADQLPVVGRGQAVIEIDVTRQGEPVHEVLGGIDGPNVIAAAAEIVRRCMELDSELSQLTHPLAGRESIFLGEIHAGVMFNQSPISCRMSGSRRWLPGTDVNEVRDQFESLACSVEGPFGVQVDARLTPSGEAYEIAADNTLIESFQHAHQSVTGATLPVGTKQFVDDGNKFVHLAGVPAITHGPNGKGAHTVNEEVSVDELVRATAVYAITAIEFCDGGC